MTHMSKLVMAIIGLVVLVIVASRQLFLFAITSKGSDMSHLWMAAAAGMSACVAGVLMFYFFGRHEETRGSTLEMTPSGPLLNAIQLKPSTSPVPAPFDAVSWALANPWLKEGQADDRMPMDGGVRDSGQTAPGQRAFARRTHQLMFKKWSQARHD